MPVLQNHSKYERMRGCNCSFIIKKVPIIVCYCYWNCELALKKGMILETVLNSFHKRICVIMTTVVSRKLTK